MNSAKKSIVMIFLLLIFGGTLFPINALAGADPGDPGGSPPPPPYLDSLPSPDYDGTITLTWRSSDGATGYRIYRSTNYDWGYVLIDTTSQLSYTDQGVSLGNYYYMVKAYNNYGISLPSNKRSVEVLAPLPSITLIGGLNRYFPGSRKLGYTIKTVSIYDDPRIHLSITEETRWLGTVNVKVFIDGIEIYHISRDFGTYIPEEFNNIYAYDLRNKWTHQIVIEITSGAGSYYLNHIQLQHLEIEESRMVTLTDDFGNEITRRFLPNISYNYGVDNAFVCVNTIPYIDNDDLIIRGNHRPTFRSIIEAFLDPDVPDKTYFGGQAAYYIYSIAMQWRIISPEGYYLSYTQLHYSVSLLSNNNGVTDYPELDWVLWMASLSVSSMGIFGVPPYITFPLSALFSLATYDVAPATTDFGNQGNYAFYGSWTAGTTTFWGDTSLNPQLSDLSIIIDWAPELPYENYGSYQIELTWFLDIRLDSGGFWGGSVSPVDGFPVSDTFYLNIQYLEND